MPRESNMPMKGGRWVIDLKTGTKMNKEIPVKNIILPSFFWLLSEIGDMVLTTTFPLKRIDIMYAGITQEAMLGIISIRIILVAVI